MSLTYQTTEELKKALKATHDRVINFKEHGEYKTMPFRDRCLANWGTTGDFVINQKAGDFGGTMKSSCR